MLVLSMYLVSFFVAWALIARGIYFELQEDTIGVMGLSFVMALVWPLTLATFCLGKVLSKLALVLSKLFLLGVKKA